MLFTDQLAQLTRLLADDQHHSGQDLAKQMGVTRANIWKNIEKLRSIGLPVSAIRNKGYRLPLAFQCLNVPHIMNKLAQDGITAPIHYYPSIDSTNEQALRLLRNNQRVPMVLLAEQQSQGRGRMGKTWESPATQNVYASIVAFLPPNFANLGTLSLHVSLALAECLQAYLPHPVQIKWPNDIICQHQKIAGILIESIAEAQQTMPIIIGVGINANHNPNHPSPYTSISEISQQNINRNDLVCDLVKSIDASMNEFQSHGFQKSHRKWQALDYLNDKSITLMQGHIKIQGIARSITPTGELLIETAGGTLTSVSHGEVHHVRPTQAVK